MTQQKNPPRDDLTHYGVKGMRWGVHKDNPSNGSAPTRKVKKADAKFEKKAGTLGTFIEVNNRAARHVNEHDVDRINNKPQYKNADFTNDSPLRRKYYAEHQKAFNDALKVAANSLGTNASGTRRYTVTVDKTTGVFSVRTESVSHAEGDAPFKIVPKFDSKGHIISFSIEEVAISHHGVKGMHWGVRKNTPTNPDYSRSQRNYDRLNLGQGGVKRINRRLNKGADIATARKQEYKFRSRRSTAITVGVVGVKYRRQISNGAKIAKAILDVFSDAAAQKIAVKAETERGRSAAAQAMGLPRKPTHGPSYSKKSRGGVHKITTL